MSRRRMSPQRSKLWVSLGLIFHLNLPHVDVDVVLLPFVSCRISVECRMFVFCVLCLVPLHATSSLKFEYLFDFLSCRLTLIEYVFYSHYRRNRLEHLVASGKSCSHITTYSFSYSFCCSCKSFNKTHIRIHTHTLRLISNWSFYVDYFAKTHCKQWEPKGLCPGLSYMHTYLCMHTHTHTHLWLAPLSPLLSYSLCVCYQKQRYVCK